MKKIVFTIILFFSFINICLAAENLTPSSKSSILIDSSSGEVLYKYNENEKLSPASMTKIASMLLIMEAIDTGKINLDDDVIISKEAASMGGSQIFLQEGDSYKVEELLKGIAIASGNDAVISLSEKVGGTTDKFVKMMNDKCSELGCTNTVFKNPHGLDEEGHYSSAYDMSLLAMELVKYDKILEYTSIYEEYLTKNDGTQTWLVNTNRLIRYYPGLDGLKTGFTDEAGYCLTATALKNDLRLISVVMGSTTSEARSDDTVNLLNYGFNSYKLFKIKDKDESIGNIDVTNGKKDNVKVYLKEDATELQNITDDNKSYEFEIKVEKIKAPLKTGDVIGKTSIIDNEGNIVDEVDIIVKEDIEKANLWDYFKKNMISVLTGNK